MVSRRAFTRLAVAGLAVPFAALDALADVGGVRVGVQTYSFRDLPRSQSGDAIDGLVRAMTDCGLTECELWAPQVEPRTARQARDQLRAWRLDTPLDHFRSVAKKFRDAGISIHAYNYSFSADMTDEEIDRGFEMTRALGAQYITASTTIATARRVAPFADRHRMNVAMHGHSNVTTSVTSQPPTSMPSRISASTTPTSPICTSRIGGEIKVTTCRGGRVTRRLPRCCRC